MGWARVEDACVGEEHTVVGWGNSLQGRLPVGSDSSLMSFISIPLGTVEGHSYGLHVRF